jgi:hypothetical protein
VNIKGICFVREKGGKEEVREREYYCLEIEGQSVSPIFSGWDIQMLDFCDRHIHPSVFKAYIFFLSLLCFIFLIVSFFK